MANAVAAVEGYDAIHYLIAHHDWKYIDTNHDGLITAQEDHELRGQFRRDGLAGSRGHGITPGRHGDLRRGRAGHQQRGLQREPRRSGRRARRFNFFDYAADGQLNGSITINELKMLVSHPLPSPDAYAITDRQRASANGFLLDPTAQRNFVALQHILPQIPVGAESQVKKYRNSRR